MPKNIKPLRNNDNKISSINAVRNKKKEMIIKLNKIKNTHKKIIEKIDNKIKRI